MAKARCGERTEATDTWRHHDDAPDTTRTSKARWQDDPLATVRGLTKLANRRPTAGAKRPHSGRPR